MKPFRDITGERFGMLVALRRAGKENGKTTWAFRCDCGKEHIARGTHVTSGRISSCGCNHHSVTAERSRTHGLSKSRGYRIWRNMINRCHYDKYPERHFYGGRGISVCQRWRESFEMFIFDMGYPMNNMSIDRIDTNGNYEPGNCRWATAKEQANNRRKATAVDRGVEPIYVGGERNDRVLEG